MKSFSISISVEKDDKADTYVANTSSWEGKRGDHYNKVISGATVHELVAEINKHVENVIAHFHNKELAKNDPNHPHKG